MLPCCRLWIASTVQPPSPQDIQELESFYQSVHAADAGAAPGISAEVQLPPAYPTGVLLGCVEVVDVVTVSPEMMKPVLCLSWNGPKRL